MRIALQARAPGNEIVLVPGVTVQGDVHCDSVLKRSAQVMTIAVPVVVDTVPVAVDVDIETHTQESRVVARVRPGNLIVIGDPGRGQPVIAQARDREDRLDSEGEGGVVGGVVNLDHERTHIGGFLLFNFLFFLHHLFLLVLLLVFFLFGLVLRAPLVVPRIAALSQTIAELEPATAGGDCFNVQAHQIRDAVSSQVQFAHHPIIHGQNFAWIVIHEQVDVPGLDRKCEALGDDVDVRGVRLLHNRTVTHSDIIGSRRPVGHVRAGVPVGIRIVVQTVVQTP